MNGLIEEAISRLLLVGAEEKQDTSFRRASLWASHIGVCIMHGKILLDEFSLN
jgi:hypothetical protein